MTPITNNSAVNHANAELETQATVGAKAVNVPPPPQNEVQHGAGCAPPPQTQGPTSGARESTQPQSTGYAATAPNVNGGGQTHDAQPVDSKELQAAKQNEKDILLLTSLNLAPRGGVTREWVSAVAHDPCRRPEERAAAQRMLTSDAWGRANKDGDAVLTINEAAAYTESMKRAAPASSGSTTDSTGETPGTPATGADGATGSGDAAAPTKTYAPTLEGSLEAMYDASASVQDKLIKLQQEAASNPDKAASLQGEISKLTGQLQTLSNMTQMLQELMSNLAKMWNDIAMHAVGNIR